MIVIKSTKQVLADSLIQLVEERDSDTVTVGEIVSNCTFSRRTFYNHFVDKSDLVTWIFANEDLIFGESSWEDCNFFYETLAHQLQLISRHSSFYAKVLGTLPGKRLFKEELKRRIRLWHDDWEYTAENDFMLDFICCGYTLEVVYWIQAGELKSPAAFVSYLKTCIPEKIFMSEKKMESLVCSEVPFDRNLHFSTGI